MTTDAYGFDPGPTKKNLIPFDSGLLTGITNFYPVLSERETRGAIYLLWVTALIYHDLVTAQEITGERRIKGPKVGIGTGGQEPSWIYIPRKVHRQRVEPRVPSPNPHFVTPHRVSGHKRQANPTDKHLKELERFERETGLRILDLLRRNPGFTFVRPHVSPSSDSVANLPRFIHARLQREIEALMQGPSPESDD